MENNTDQGGVGASGTQNPLLNKVRVPGETFTLPS